ncbi:magnesium transporter [Chromobacterium alkanivorans]|uniref:magnesium transporter n=1 Tax=Chromobacterium TaxID=535 RepID=UPI000654A751|nr:MULTISPECIES: magnesium transporter [Chromobacterium]KMN83586.1 magnesium transporter [Chromobacterium sp. LK11]MBN3005175.1 magnesium transporter [Chromobacterium alkanivorans]MCS3806201.1 magnesium transporter [Chromobacterium alkanivorans]MCS3820397.1 magnesium transporter [Chromobacterium alkanivorans]MCS3875155.1 magnesium transporter [Chromobacterium alkanivorans]
MTVAFKQQSADRLQESLALVQRLIERQRQLEDLVSRPEVSEPPTDPLAPHYNLEALRLKLEQLHPADVAHILEALPLEDRLLVWDQVDGARDGAILLEVSDAVRESLIEVMEHGELVNAAEQLDADELAELAPDMPRQVVYEVMGGLDEEERAQLQSALSYDEDKVGALMDFDLVKIRADVSCEVVLRYLRRFDELPAHTDKIFVIDDLGLLKGVLSIRKLLVSDPDALVAEVMATELVSFSPDEDAADAALAFERYDLITAPVVDEAGKLIGRLTVDEMVDVIREESDSEVLNLAGLKEEEDLFAPVIDSVKNRWAWLAINLCTAFVASRVIGVFEHSISQLVALAALMPIVAGIGGNSGNQTITMIVRALAMGQMQLSQAWRLWRKELRVSMINGVLWGGVIGSVAWLLYGSFSLGLVMLGAMLLNLMLAATMGVLIPCLMQRSGRDPALGSSVLITACTDSGGFFIFLGLATLFLL